MLVSVTTTTLFVALRRRMLGYRCAVLPVAGYVFYVICAVWYVMNRESFPRAVCVLFVFVLHVLVLILILYLGEGLSLP